MSKMASRDGNKERRADRQVQAQIRKEAYDKLTTVQKLARLEPIRKAGGAKKQVAKLAAKLAEEQSAKKGKAA